MPPQRPTRRSAPALLALPLLLACLTLAACGGSENPHLPLLRERARVMEDLNRTVAEIHDVAGARLHADEIAEHATKLRSIRAGLDELGDLSSDALHEVSQAIGARTTAACLEWDRQSTRLRADVELWSIVGPLID